MSVFLGGGIGREFMQTLPLGLSLLWSQRFVVDCDKASYVALSSFDDFFGRIGIFGFFPEHVAHWQAMPIGVL
jgi:hypothetical protein